MIFAPMANSASNGGVDRTGLYLPTYTGEVLTFFQDNLLLTGLVDAKPAVKGYEVQFSRFGQVNSEQHELNAEILGTNAEQAKVSYYLDKRAIISANTMDDVENELAQWETRSKLAAEQGAEIARRMEKRVAALICKAGLTAAISGTSFPGGGIGGTGAVKLNTNFTSSDPTVSSAAICKAIDDWLIWRDQANHPDGEIYCVIPPQQWHGLRNFNGVIYVAANISATAAASATGLNPFMPNLSVGASRKDFLLYKGVKIYQSNFIPSTNTLTSGYLDEANTYGGDFTKVFGAIWQREAVGFVTVRAPKVEAWRTPSRQNETLMTSMMTGGGAVRCELACTLTHTA